MIIKNITELVKSMVETKRLLLKVGKYKKIIIDDSDKMTVEPYNGKALSLYDNEYSNAKDDIMSIESQNTIISDAEKKDEEEEDDEEEDQLKEPRQQEQQKQRKRIREKVQPESQEYLSKEKDKEEEEEEEQIATSSIKKKEEGEEIAKKYITMGKNLYSLLQNINKIPSPPPTNASEINTGNYRSLLIDYLSSIDDVGQFDQNYNDIFTTIIDDNHQSSQKSSLNFILNEEEEEKQIKSNALVTTSAKEQDLSVQDVISNFDRDPSSLLDLPSAEFENKKHEACIYITNIIVIIYEKTLQDHRTTELLRRRQFRYLIMLCDYYEKLEKFCSLCKTRSKGVTIKSQAINMIAAQSTIKLSTISSLLIKASRVQRLLQIASNNYNILYSFPDLYPQFFSPTKLSVVNFERWLKLVETNELPPFEEGEKLYNEYKESAKQLRSDKFNQ